VISRRPPSPRNFPPVPSAEIAPPCRDPPTTYSDIASSRVIRLARRGAERDSNLPVVICSSAPVPNEPLRPQGGVAGHSWPGRMATGLRLGMVPRAGRRPALFRTSANLSSLGRTRSKPVWRRGNGDDIGAGAAGFIDEARRIRSDPWWVSRPSSTIRYGKAAPTALTSEGG
jgi:hypothetical protein